MAKPSKTKASNRSRRRAKAKAAAPKPVDVVTTAPEPQEPESTEEPKQEIATLDHDADGHAGGSEPDSTEPTVDAQEHKAEAEAPKPVAPFERCSLGPVECRIGRVPLNVVLGLLSPDGLRRIEAEKSTASFESLRQRLIATDGRATPAIFEVGADDGVQPTILHGYAEIAAAEDVGAGEVSVILVPPGGASDAQSHIVEMVRKQRDSGKPSEDDELFYRVHAED